MPDQYLAETFVLFEPVLFIFAGFALFRNAGRTLAESISSAVMTTLMLISLLQLTAGFVGMSILHLIMETGIAATAAGLCWRYRKLYFLNIQMLKPFVQQRNSFIMTAFLSCLAYLACRAYAFTPTTEHLNSFEMIASYTPGFSFFPTNSMILSRHFLRFNTTSGIGIVGFAGYIVLISSTYSLSRRYAWMPISFTVALMVASMPRFIHHSQGPGFEIVPASMALFAILLSYRLIETPQLSDLLLLIISLVFISSHGPISLIFAGILAILCLLLLFRRHGLIIWMMVKKEWKMSCAALVPIIIFSKAWVFTKLSIFTGLAKNRDEIIGGLANCVRYFFENIDVTLPVNQFCIQFGMVSPYAQLQSLYLQLFEPIFGQKGAALPFQITGQEGELFCRAWFGPFGIILVSVAVIYAMVRGPRRLKAVAVALTVYLYLLCLIPAWRPENVSYFSYFYACAGYTTAHILPPWHLGLKAKLGIQVICIILMIDTIWGQIG